MPIETNVQKEIETSLKFLGILACLIILTITRSYLHLPVVYSIFIEITKIGIVVGYFAHLIAGRKMIHFVWMMTIIFVLGLLVLPLANRIDKQKGSEDIAVEGIKQEKNESGHVH